MNVKKKKISENAKNIYIYISVNARKLKSGVIFFLASHVYHPNLSTFLAFFWCPKSVFLILFCWLPQTRKSSSFTSFSIPLSLLFFLSSSFVLTWQPSLSHQSKISLSKEEIKELILKFQLQIVGDK